MDAIGFEFDFLGVRTRKAYDSGVAREDQGIPEPLAEEPSWPQQEVVTGADRDECLPGLNEEYFEWIDVIQSIQRACNQYTIIELGAGYGRWLVRAVVVLRCLAPELPFSLVAVEAEPTHMRFLHEHLTLNGITPGDHWLIQAAVAGSPGEAKFIVGEPTSFYGQQIVASFTGMPAPCTVRPGQKDHEVELVPAIDLASILERLDHVDLIDLDVQQAEHEVLGAGIDELDAKVSRLHIGTHAPQIEAALRELLGGRGWICINDYGCKKTRDTPYGPIEFGDGVQTWLNSHFNPERALDR